MINGVPVSVVREAAKLSKLSFEYFAVFVATGAEWAVKLCRQVLERK